MGQQQTQDRRWEIDLEGDEFGNVNLRQFEEDIRAEHLRLADIEFRLGGASQSYVIRQQDEESGLWFPVKAVFKWQSFVPGIRGGAPAQQPRRDDPSDPEQVREEESAGEADERDEDGEES